MTVTPPKSHQGKQEMAFENQGRVKNNSLTLFIHPFSPLSLSTLDVKGKTDTQEKQLISIKFTHFKCIMQPQKCVYSNSEHLVYCLTPT